jgi:hypothetical protein
MLLAGWYAEDVNQEPGQVARCRIPGSGVTREKGASSLYSFFLLGLGDERAFLNLPRRAIWAVESFELSNRIEEPDTKIEKNWQQSKSTFSIFLGSAVLAGNVTLFLFFLQLYPPFFFEIFFYSVKFGTFWRSGRKHPFGWWKISKKNGNLGNSARGLADVWCRICIRVNCHGPAWFRVRQGFGRNSAWSDAWKNLKYFLRVDAREFKFSIWVDLNRQPLIASHPTIK